MREQVEIVYENGALSPLETPTQLFQKQEHVTVSVEDAAESIRRLAEAEPTVNLEAVHLVHGQKLEQQTSCDTLSSLHWMVT